MATTTHVSISQAPSGSEARRKLGYLTSILLSCTAPAAVLAQDLPHGGQVAAGAASIGAATNGQMTVRQTSDTAVINWNSFDVGSGKTLRFNQPSRDAAILNRVTGAARSDIHGTISANGQVHVVNPNGILIGRSGQVQAAGGFVGSTLNITNDDFMNRELRYRGNGASADVVNNGAITIGRGGFAALMGGHVKNNGTVSVPLGRVGFASGERVTLNISGDGFMQVAVPTTANSAEGEALIENAGRVQAAGGRIEMKAATARHAVRHAINLSGVAEASSVSVRGGTIVLGGGAGGTVKVTGKVRARSAPAPVYTPPRQSAPRVSTSPRPPARPGGDVTITAAQIYLLGANVDVSGVDGGGRIRVGGDFAGQGELPHATTVVIDGYSAFEANALANGDGGRIIVWSDRKTKAAGSFAARGGPLGGNGGFVEVSSKNQLQYFGQTNTLAPKGTTGMLLLDPTNIEIVAGTAVGADESAAQISSDLLSTSVTVQTNIGGTEAGDILVSAPITWDGIDTTLNLVADRNIRFNAPITTDQGNLTLSAVGSITTGSNGVIDVDRFILNSGNWRQLGPQPSFLANDFDVRGGASFLRAAGGNGDTQPYRLTDVFGLQGVGTSDTLLASNYIVMSDIDASETKNWRVISDFTGFVPIGSDTSGFTGTFDGNGYTIDGISVERVFDGEGLSSDAAGLFGWIGDTDASGFNGLVTDLTLTNVDIFGGVAGGLAAVNLGEVRRVRVSGNVASVLDGFVSDVPGSVSGGDVGGLVGLNVGEISQSLADVDVESFRAFGFSSGRGGPSTAGGAVGTNFGTISETAAFGDVAIFDDGVGSLGFDFDGPVVLSAGGFAGINSGDISDSYAKGNVLIDMTGSGTYAGGGFVGSQQGGGINQSFSIGQAIAEVTPPVSDSPAIGSVGGFAGEDISMLPLSSGNFWDRITSGTSTSALGTALTTAQFQGTQGFITRASSQGWVFTGTNAVWAPGASGLYPSLYSTSPVIYAELSDIELVYGEDAGTIGLGQVYGGPGTYVFDTRTTDFAATDVLTNLVFGDRNAGTTSYSTVATIGSSGFPQFDVISRPATATITPRPLTISANDLVKLFGDSVIFGLNDVTVELDDGTTATGLIDGDTVTFVSLSSPGAASDASVDGSPYTIMVAGAEGFGLSNYEITYVVGTLVVEPTVTPPPPPPPPPPTPPPPTPVVVPTVPPPSPPVVLPNPGDTLPSTLVLVAGQSATLIRAEETLSVTRSIANDLTTEAQSCSGASDDVTRYLSCLSDALNNFSGELDEIVNDLPPGLANVAQIVQDARRSVDAASTRASRRLAGATTNAERESIRRDAINEARTAMAGAATEIRKAISLVRASDPELANIQRETITTVALAVDSVNIELSRAIGL